MQLFPDVFLWGWTDHQRAGSQFRARELELIVAEAELGRASSWLTVYGNGFGAYLPPGSAINSLIPSLARPS